MKTTLIDFESTNSFSRLFLDYINEKPELQEFYQEYPRIESFEKYFKSYEGLDRIGLQEELKYQHKELRLSEIQSTNLDSINDKKTFTVTTGHQLNIFGGPMFFIYKILTTIRTCEVLKNHYPEYNFVPVFWMATEDHDFEEINFFNFDQTTFNWRTDQSGAVGRFSNSGLEEFIQEIPNCQNLFKAYTTSTNLAEATREIVHELFKDYGLLVIDGDSNYLKSQFAEIMSLEISENYSEKAVLETTIKLEGIGFKGQVHPREINLFYLSNQYRERIIKEDKGFKTVDDKFSWSLDEIQAELKTTPENFSPNVILRPVYQQKILPNLSYIGGPGEIAYWLQLKTVFETYKVVLPIIQPRNFGLILDTYAQKKMEKFGISDVQLFRKWDSWKKDYLTSQTVEYSLNTERDSINKQLDQLEESLTNIDKNLTRTLIAQKTKINKHLDKLETKARSGQERCYSDQLKQLQRVRDFAFPNNIPQERELSFVNFLNSDRTIINQLYKAFDPMSKQFYLMKDE